MNKAMYLSVYPGSAEPIYAQLIGQVRRLIAGGQLKAGDRLPSVREIATSLTINPMTVSKAFTVLEAEKLLRRVPGVAMIAAEHHAEAMAEQPRLEMLQPSLERAADEARQLQLPTTRVRWLFMSILVRACQIRWSPTSSARFSSIRG